MQSILCLVAIIATVVVAAPTRAATKVFILAGQSNMDGRGKKSDLVGPLAKFAEPQADLRIAYSNSTMRGPFHTDGFVPLQPGFSVPPGAKKESFKLPGNTFGPEVSFGRAIADVMPHDKIVLIKFSEGGTSLHSDWKLDKPGGLYEQGIAFIRASLKNLSDSGESYELAGIIWHQGESDASLDPGKYQELLTRFITQMRRIWIRPGSRSSSPKSSTTRSAIMSARASAPRRRPCPIPCSSPPITSIQATAAPISTRNPKSSSASGSPAHFSRGMEKRKRNNHRKITTKPRRARSGCPKFQNPIAKHRQPALG